MPQVSSSRMDVLTFDRATLNVSAISSAGSAFGDRYNNAWICATVRLIPQRVPISPQWSMYCFCNAVSSAMSVLSVQTESKEGISGCQPGGGPQLGRRPPHYRIFFEGGLLSPNSPVDSKD